ncbi:hypothetical protein [Micrococcus sp. HMSC067E09]|uniref:hypothetical protein n=1 Tax=Micrococcus sp. HMSC067E09 TaxID=1739367 RepID=UPI000A754641|nr:hypothetical protein [Micrococcus sp. HMSC067E09]
MSDSPFTPLEFSAQPREEPAAGGEESAAGGDGAGGGVPWRSRDRHGRGLRHPLPLGRRARRTRQDRLETAVEKAVEKIGGLGEPALIGMVVRVQRIPDHADGLLRELRAGMPPGPERLWASVGRRGDGTLVVTLHERPILSAVESDELDTAVYATVLARCAEEIGRDPEQLDPGWGSL